MDKPSVYLDTSIISAYWYDGGDIASIARRLKTREWWDLERTNFSVWSSSIAEKELRGGKYPRQLDCVRTARRMRYLPVLHTCEQLADELLAARVIPATKGVDALHLAIGTAHGVDYLLGWNYAHLANPVTQQQLIVFCRTRDLRPPLLVSPESIPKLSMGETIRRRDR